MKPNTPDESDNVDSIIRDALNQKNAEDILNYSSDPSIFQMLGATFQGRLRWVSIMSIVVILIFLGLGIYSSIQFLAAEETKEALVWGAGAMFCVMTISMIKIWCWLEMGRRSVSREIKRLELRIAALAEK